MNTTVAPTGPGLRLKIGGMDCGSCALTLEQALRGLPGVTAVKVNFTTETLEASGSAPQAAMSLRFTASALWPSRSGSTVDKKCRPSTSMSQLMQICMPDATSSSAASSPTPSAARRGVRVK